MLAHLARDTMAIKPLAYWVSKLRELPTETLELAEDLSLELSTKTATSLACMLRSSVGTLPQAARRLLCVAIAARVAIPWSTCASLLNSEKDSTELTRAVNRLKALSLIVDDLQELYAHPIVRRAVHRLLGPQEVEHAAQALIAHLRSDYSVDSTLAERHRLDPVVLALTQNISDASRMLLARTWVDWKVKEVEGVHKSLSTKLTWMPEVISPVREPDDPWMLIWCLLRNRNYFFDALPIKVIVNRIAAGPADAVDADCVQWALELATTMLERDQDEVAATLSYTALKNREKGNIGIYARAYVINQRACYRLRDTDKAQPLELANIAAESMGKDSPATLAAVQDAACAAYLRGETDLGLYLVGESAKGYVRLYGLLSLESLNATYVTALLARQGRQFEQARGCLIMSLPAWEKHPAAAFFGRVLWMRLLADICRSLGERDHGLRYMKQMRTLICEHPNPLSSLVAERSIEAQASALREAGEYQDANDLLMLLRNDLVEPPNDLPPIISEIQNLDRRIAEYENLVLMGDGDCFVVRRDIENTTIAAVSHENPLARFVLTNTLGLLLIPDSTHARLIDLVAGALPWNTAAEVLEDINWEFRHSNDERKRVGYAKRSAERLRRAVKLREANNTDVNMPILVARVLLAQAHAFFDSEASENELVKIEQMLPGSPIRSEDQQRVTTEIGALRSRLKN